MAAIQLYGGFSHTAATGSWPRVRPTSKTEAVRRIGALRTLYTGHRDGADQPVLELEALDQPGRQGEQHDGLIKPLNKRCTPG